VKRSETKSARLSVWGGIIARMSSRTRKRRKREASKKRREYFRLRDEKGQD